VRGKQKKIRVLDTQEDLYRAFIGEDDEKDVSAHAPRETETFGGMLEESLSGIGQAEIIRQKHPEADEPVRQKTRVRQHCRPGAELDLHGCYVDEALLRVEAFIETSSRQALDVVRIIVGKGLHSQGRAVLPDAVEEKIIDLKVQGRVAVCIKEHKHKRFSGSLLVYLK